MKAITKIFIYGSLIAFLIYLYQIDFLIFKSFTFNYLYLALSLFCLFSGFIFSAISWKEALNLHGIQIAKKESIVSHGMPVFTKYIPGRIWTILGRAALVKTEKTSLKFLSFISLKEQLIYLSLGFLISIYPIFKTEKISDYGFVIVLISVSMLVVLFSKSIQSLIERIWNRIFKKEIQIPIIKFSEFFKLSMYILFYWILWAAGFYLLLLSIFEDIPIYFAFAFPLSISLGLISIIFPGGIGIREGVISLFLISNGIEPEIAVSISVISRIWFVIGEIFIFIVALVNRKSHGQKL